MTDESIAKRPQIARVVLEGTETMIVRYAVKVDAPNLIGSPSQINWAHDIRADELRIWVKELEWKLFSRPWQTGPSPKPIEPFERSDAQMLAVYQAECDRINNSRAMANHVDRMSVWFAEESAAEWIRRRPRTDYQPKVRRWR